MVNNYRFIKEYRNFLIRELKNNDMISKEIRNEKISTINKYVNACYNGLVSVNECMHTISKWYD